MAMNLRIATIMMEHRGHRGNGRTQSLFFGIDHAAEAIAQMLDMEVDQQADFATRKTRIGE
jgi:hypothetical protein